VVSVDPTQPVLAPYTQPVPINAAGVPDDEDADNPAGETAGVTQGAIDNTNDFGFDDDPTRVSIQDFAVDSVATETLLEQLDLDRDSALSLLARFDPELAESLDGASLEAILTELERVLDADGDGTIAVVHWVTREERGTAGFYVERRPASGGGWVRLNGRVLPGRPDGANG
jgi:hypothetical protein